MRLMCEFKWIQWRPVRGRNDNRISAMMTSNGDCEHVGDDEGHVAPSVQGEEYECVAAMPEKQVQTGVLGATKEDIARLGGTETGAREKHSSHQIVQRHER